MMLSFIMGYANQHLTGACVAVAIIGRKVNVVDTAVAYTLHFLFTMGPLPRPRPPGIPPGATCTLRSYRGFIGADTAAVRRILAVSVSVHRLVLKDAVNCNRNVISIGVVALKVMVSGSVQDSYRSATVTTLSASMDTVRQLFPADDQLTSKGTGLSR